MFPADAILSEGLVEKLAGIKHPISKKDWDEFLQPQWKWFPQYGEQLRTAINMVPSASSTVSSTQLQGNAPSTTTPTSTQPANESAGVVSARVTLAPVIAQPTNPAHGDSNPPPVHLHPMTPSMLSMSAPGHKRKGRDEVEVEDDGRGRRVRPSPSTSQPSGSFNMPMMSTNPAHYLTPAPTSHRFSTTQGWMDAGPSPLSMQISTPMRLPTLQSSSFGAGMSAVPARYPHSAPTSQHQMTTPVQHQQYLSQQFQYPQYSTPMHQGRYDSRFWNEVHASSPVPSNPQHIQNSEYLIPQIPFTIQRDPQYSYPTSNSEDFAMYQQNRPYAPIAPSYSQQNPQYCIPQPRFHSHIEDDYSRQHCYTDSVQRGV
ncbi:hypothetical protein FA15DRAFT_710656 [Coprinopsis marcescibilis]|uniref:Uncharacterized protein n=1 Tax=Coprinopsis marcescibilis TaxID=230819 RepID=A0A5C3KBY1_COPMA|nr:hypothetical protein FA15DRAFT_710656 [Coprinopsis marcescibilis]